MCSRYCSWWAVAMTVLLVAACAPSITPANPKVGNTPAMLSPEPSLTRPASAPLTGEESTIEQVVADLSKRLNVPASDVKVVTQETATWPDGGLGCPQPGFNYIQVPVDGLRLILSYAGATYEYHTGQSVFVLCETTVLKPALTPIPLEPSGVLTPEITMASTLQIESGLQPLVDTAAADLANRLSIDRSAVEVVSAQSVVWPDRSLGCPQPDMGYIQVLSEGYRIELRVKGQIYSYHGGEGRGPFLCENPSK